MHGFTLWSSVTTYCAWMPQKSRIPCFYLFTNLQSEKYFTWRSILSSKHCAWSSIINNNMYSSFILYITIYFLTWLDERRVLQLVIYNRGTSVNFLPFYIKLESFNMFHAFTEPPSLYSNLQPLFQIRKWTSPLSPCSWRYIREKVRWDLQKFRGFPLFTDRGASKNSGSNMKHDLYFLRRLRKLISL